MATEQVNLKCRSCGTNFTADKPAGKGFHVFNCPSCGHEMKVQLNPVNIKLAGADGPQKPKIPQIGVPQKAQGKNRLYVIKQRAVTGRMYMMTCPECGFGIVNKVVKPGNNKWTCPKCGVIVAYAANTPEAIKQAEEAKAKAAAAKKEAAEKAEKEKEESEKVPTYTFHGDELKVLGELVWGGFFSTKRFPLHVGPITIGRKDSEAPSDLQLDDRFVSRQSVTIETIPGGNGFSFKFTVRKTTNPIFVNSTEVITGNSIFLNYGDTITIGKTKLTFKKSKQK